jgi:DNA-binding CsgD family transcriptional regulator
MMSLLKRLLQKLGLASGGENRTFEVSADLLPIIEAYAEAEGRTPDDVLSDMVSFAARERQRARSADAGWERLTAREQEVVALACLGYSNPAIAAFLVISPHTTRNHLRNAYQRLGIRSKRELRAYFHGWDFDSWARRSVSGYPRG